MVGPGPGSSIRPGRTVAGASGGDPERVGPTLVTDAPERTRELGDAPCVLDADPPANRAGAGLEGFWPVVGHEPAVHARGALRPGDIFGARLGAPIDVEGAAAAPAALPPRDRRSAGLLDVQIEVGPTVPEERELRVAHPDLDPSDRLLAGLEAGDPEPCDLRWCRRQDVRRPPRGPGRRDGAGFDRDAPWPGSLEGSRVRDARLGAIVGWRDGRLRGDIGGITGPGGASHPATVASSTRVPSRRAARGLSGPAGVRWKPCPRATSRAACRAIEAAQPPIAPGLGRRRRPRAAASSRCRDAGIRGPGRAADRRADVPARGFPVIVVGPPCDDRRCPGDAVVRHGTGTRPPAV